LIDPLFTRAHVIARFQESLLQPHLSDLAARLQRQGYSHNVIHAYLSSAEKFGQWLSVSNLNASDVNDNLIARYIAEAVRRGRAKSEPQQDDKKARTGLVHLVRMLRDKQVIPAVPVALPSTAAQRWLMAFEQHLVQVVGAALNTRKKCVSLAKHFVAQRFGDGPVHWGILQADHVAPSSQGKPKQREVLAGCDPCSPPFLRILGRYSGWLGGGSACHP